MEETLEAFDDLVASGKVRYVGFTNLEAWRVAKAVLTSDAEGWARFVAGQYQYSLVERSIEHEFVPLFLAEGIGLTCWDPLGGGFLSGKYRRDRSGFDPRGVYGPRPRQHPRRALPVPHDPPVRRARVRAARVAAGGRRTVGVPGTMGRHPNGRGHERPDLRKRCSCEHADAARLREPVPAHGLTHQTWRYVPTLEGGLHG